MARDIVIKLSLGEGKMKEFEKNFTNGLVKNSSVIQKVIKTALKSKGNPSGKFPSVKKNLGLIPLGIYNTLKTSENWKLIDEEKSEVRSDDSSIELNFVSKSQGSIDKIATRMGENPATLLSRSIEKMSRYANRQFSSIFKSAIDRME